MDFPERLTTEEARRAYLFASRLPEGFVCPAWGGGEAGRMHRQRRVWQCKGCGHQTSVTAGTVMHGTRTPLPLCFGPRIWWPRATLGSRPSSCSELPWASRRLRNEDFRLRGRNFVAWHVLPGTQMS
jgi:hypothetical protein